MTRTFPRSMIRLVLLALVVMASAAFAPARAQDGGAAAAAAGAGGAGAGGGGAPTQTPNDRAVLEEAAFIERMMKDAGEGGPGKGDGKDGAGKTPAGGGAKKEETADGSEDGGDDEGADDEAGDDTRDDDGSDEDAGADGDDDAGVGDDAGDDSGDGAGDAAGDGDDDHDDDGDADGDGDGEADDEFGDLSSEQQLARLEKALKQYGAKAVVDKLPKALQPVARRRLQEMESAFTRAMKEQTSFRAERTQLLAEKKFRDDNPVDDIVERLMADPNLSDQVNERLEEIGASATNREAHSVVVKDKKGRALEAVTAESTQAEQRLERARQVESYVEREMTRRGIPAELGVEEAVALHITEHGDITREDIDRILSAKQKQADRLQRGNRRGARRDYVDNKLKDRRTAGLKVAPGRGASPTPGKGKVAQNDAEFATQMDAALAARGL